MKILILTNYADGLYLFRRELLMELLAAGHRILVSVPWDEQCRKIEELGCEVIPTVLERRGSNPVKDLKLLFFYKGLLKREAPDVVLTYTIKPNLYGGLACRRGHVPCICNITGLGTAIESNGILSKVLLCFYKISMAKADCVFFQNKGNRIFMQKYGIAKKNSRLLPGSGVNLQQRLYRTYPSETDGIRFLAVIRIMKDKGIDEYLQAAERITQTYQKVSFYLAGEYEEETREQYESILGRLEKEKVVKYLGHIDNVEEVMANSHVIVHPSYHEGLSNVLLEGAACGRPVLASNIAGCRETVSENVSGILFEPKQTEALTGAIERILSLTFEERRAMGIAARKWVEEHFDRKIVIKAYQEELQKIKNRR